MSTLLRSTLGAILIATAFHAHAADGDPDPSFAGGAAFVALDGVEGHELRISAAVTLPDGKLLFGGGRNRLIEGNPDPSERAVLIRLNADGGIDRSFGSDPANPGVVVLPDLVVGTAIQSIEDLRQLPDGSLVAAGTAQAFGPLTGFVVKMRPDGTLDAAFGAGGVARVADTLLHALAVDAEGRIVAVGEREDVSSATAVVMRFTPAGALDTAFGKAGDGIVEVRAPHRDAYGYLHTIAIAPDGNIVVGGSHEVPDPMLPNNHDFLVARLKANGLFDVSFATAGVLTFNLPEPSEYDGVDELLVTPRSEVVVAGHFDDPATGLNAVIGRITAHGQIDATFGESATPGFTIVRVADTAYNRYPSGLARQSDGRLVFSIITSGGPDKSLFVAARTLADGQLDTSFGSNGIVGRDLAPGGHYSVAMALTLDANRPLLAGASKRADGPILELAAVRLENDSIFTDRFGAD